MIPMQAALALLLVALPLARGPAQKGKGDSAKAFAGSWMTTLGPMKLEAKGSSVSGEYGWSMESEVEGKLGKEGLALELSGPYGKRSGSVTLWKDGATFVGELEGGGDAQAFGGYRLEPARAEAKPGEVTDGQTQSGLNYHLRVPKGFDPKKRYTAVALFHGSNTNSRDYVEGFPGNWPELADRYVLVGFDGEHLSPASREGARAFNATYVEFSGDRVGEPWRYNQTPWLVAQALEQLEQELPIERWYVSGHSQGGFLTLAVAMFYPERIAGALEVAGGLLVQCEPGSFDDAELEAAQRRVPIAIVHGRKDSVVEFSMAQAMFDSLDDGGFPALRLFAPEKLGHPWAFLPIDEALGWLDAMNSGEAGELLEQAEGALADERYRDASALLARLKERTQEAEPRQRAEALAARLDQAAAPEAEALAKLMATDKDHGWVDRFWEFRARFGTTPSAQGVVRAYLKLREGHEDAAAQRFWRARGMQDAKQRKAVYQEIVDEYYASSWYRLAKRALER